MGPQSKRQTKLNSKIIDVALAIIEFDLNLDLLEGSLLAAAGSSTTLSPTQLSDKIGASQSDAEAIFLQLRRIDAVSRSSEDSEYYDVESKQTRDLFSRMRDAQEVIGQYQRRQPERTTVEPLVTFPQDPHFQDLVPESFDMEWLMPTLVRMIKRASQEIIILTPYLEWKGLERVEGPLLDAVAKGVDVTIITRYLGDKESINRSVLTDLWEGAVQRGIDTEKLELIDYIVWEKDVPESERSQNGENPAYTLHAKMLLVDGGEAYIGSANVTDYGFSRYLEAGVRISGPAVMAWGNLVAQVRQSSGARSWRPR